MTNRLMSIAVACTACAAMAVTTADYVQDGLIAHWDAIDNAGTGTHDPTAATWKNLVPGGMDLTIDTAVWADGNCLSNDVGFAAHGSAILDYTSCEFLIKNDKPANTEMLMVFSNGRNKYSSVCAQKAPARLGFPGPLPQRRVVWLWFGAFPGAFGLGSEN